MKELIEPEGSFWLVPDIAKDFSGGLTIREGFALVVFHALVVRGIPLTEATPQAVSYADELIAELQLAQNE